MCETPDLAVLLRSWEISLQAERKSPNTVKVYGDSARAFLAWCAGQGRPVVLDRPTVAAFTASLLEHGAEAATANVRHRSLRRFGAWLADEGELPANPLLGMNPPKLDHKVVPKLSGDELRLLLKACEGKRLSDRRDEAMVRLAVEAMCRAEELLSMTVDDVDLRRGLATITRGKGGRGRIVPFGPQTARAIDRYLRLRRSHLHADSPALWLGDRGKGLGYSGLYISLRHRAEAAGISDFHPHRLRHIGRVPVAPGRRVRRWPDGGGRVELQGHAVPLHRRHRQRTGRRGVTAAEPGRPVSVPSVRLRCGHCRRLLDRAEGRIAGWVLGSREDNMIPVRVTSTGAAYRCKCGKVWAVNAGRVAELAPAAHKTGRDLLAGLRNYGL